MRVRRARRRRQARAAGEVDVEVAQEGGDRRRVHALEGEGRVAEPLRGRRVVVFQVDRVDLLGLAEEVARVRVDQVRRAPAARQRLRGEGVAQAREVDVRGLALHRPPVRQPLEVAAQTPIPSRVEARGCEAHGRAAGHHAPAGLQQPIPGAEHRRQHRLAEQERAHPLGDDDVEGTVHILHVVLHDLHDVADAVRGRDVARLRRHAGTLDGDDARRARLRAQHAQHAGARAHVQDDAALDFRLAGDGNTIRVHARLVLEHAQLHR